METQKIILLSAVAICVITLVGFLYIYLKKRYQNELLYINWHSEQQRKRDNSIHGFLNH